jgi:hypothetical protein
VITPQQDQQITTPAVEPLSIVVMPHHEREPTHVSRRRPSDLFTNPPRRPLTGRKHQRVATIYNRSSTYWVRFQHHGKELRRSARTTCKTTARRFLAHLLDEHHRLDRGGRPRRTYKEALERFTHDYRPTLKPTTQERYRSNFRQLTAVFGNLHLDEITRGRLVDYASDRMKAGGLFWRRSIVDAFFTVALVPGEH